jgi:hypothetical protein
VWVAWDCLCRLLQHLPLLPSLLHLPSLLLLLGQWARRQQLLQALS